MSTSRADYETALVAEIAKHGVTKYEIRAGGKHMKLVFVFQGKEYRYPFPSSPSKGGVRQCVSNLRRVMGVRPVPRKKAVAPKPRRKASPRPLECPSLTVGDDPFAALKDLDVSDVPAFAEVHAKRAPIQPVGPSLWARFCDGIRRLA